MSENEISGKETSAEKPLVFFFGGMNMEQHSNKPVVEMLSDLHGKQSADVVGFSSILSSEVIKAERFAEMSQQLESALESKREVTVIVYSLGAVEFSTALLDMLDKREKKRKGEGRAFEPIDLSNFHLVLRSPAGIVQKWSDSWREVLQLKDLLTSLGKDANAQMETTMNFPPKKPDGTFFLDKAWSVLQKLYPESSAQGDFIDRYSQSASADRVMPGREVTRDFLEDSRFDSIRQPLRELDAQLWKELQKVVPDEQELKDLFRARHEVLSKAQALSQVLDNKDQLLTGEDWKKKTIKTAAAALLGLPRVLKRALFGFGNKEIYRWLKSRGAKISLVIPDSEVFAPLETMEEFFDTEDRPQLGAVRADTIILEPGSHISLTGNTDNLARALRAAQRTNLSQGRLSEPEKG